VVTSRSRRHESLSSARVSLVTKRFSRHHKSLLSSRARRGICSPCAANLVAIGKHLRYTQENRSLAPSALVMTNRWGACDDEPMPASEVLLQIHPLVHGCNLV